MSYVTTIVLVLFGVYVANSIYVIYHLFHLPECQGGVRKCLRPDGVIDKELEISSTWKANFTILKDKQPKLYTNWRGKAYIQCTIIRR